MKVIGFCNKLIEFSFYALFLLIPLIFSSSTSELFEFPKMFMVFGIAIIIGTAWFVKMILQGKFSITRTPLDIPLILFVMSQIISSIFSLDSYVSFWGYYSRFNGGLLSTIVYFFLFYAFVSNFDSKKVIRVIKLGLFSGFLVAIWGLPSHFGADPTCYVFRQSFDTSCWTENFKPTIRIFSTLGQPAWMAAFMALLIPIAIAFGIKNTKYEIQNTKPFMLTASYFLLAILFYVDLIYTNTRAGFIAFLVSCALFWMILYFKNIFSKQVFLRYFLLFNMAFLACNFVAGVPLGSLNKYTLPELMNKSEPSTPKVVEGFSGNTNITDSGKIRLLVWRGAIDAWIDNPIIGTGVETFAFAYYKYRPIEHNLTSEWDFLYNKAHNEYLNYLTTSGILGLGSYLGIIGTFIFVSFRQLKTLHSASSGQENQKAKVKNSIQKSNINLSNSVEIIALLSAYCAILITNFFGFSVVITNLYFFLIPAFVFVLGNFLKDGQAPPPSKVSAKRWVLVCLLLVSSIFFTFSLLSFYAADTSYATGSTLNKSGNYQEAYPSLLAAVNIKGNEPVYMDELSLNLATIGSALYIQNDPESAKNFVDNALLLNDQVVNTHPNNVVFWKNRVRLFYTLAQGDEKNSKAHLESALKAITKAQELAPNDAKISYNLGVLVGQSIDPKKGIEVLENTIKLKPDYRDAYYALGLFYHDLSVDPAGGMINPELNQKAIDSYRYILENINPRDTEAKDALEAIE